MKQKSRWNGATRESTFIVPDHGNMENIMCFRHDRFNGSNERSFIQIKFISNEAWFYERAWNYLFSVKGKWLILLEVQGKPVSGLRMTDVMNWIADCCKQSLQTPIMFKTTSCSGPFLLYPDLRMFMAQVFPDDSGERRIQLAIRNNIQTLTIPLTTRLPRHDESDKHPYIFVTREVLFDEQCPGSIFECGVYEGNYYANIMPGMNGNPIGKFSQPDLAQITRRYSFNQAISSSEDHYRRKHNVKEAQLSIKDTRILDYTTLA